MNKRLKGDTEYPRPQKQNKMSFVTIIFKSIVIDIYFLSVLATLASDYTSHRCAGLGLELLRTLCLHLKTRKRL